MCLCLVRVLVTTYSMRQQPCQVGHGVQLLLEQFQEPGGYIRAGQGHRSSTTQLQDKYLPFCVRRNIRSTSRALQNACMHVSDQTIRNRLCSCICISPTTLELTCDWEDRKRTILCPKNLLIVAGNWSTWSIGHTSPCKHTVAIETIMC